MTKTTKPLGRKAYGSIGHMPNSRLGPGDHCVPQGMADICTKHPRDKHDRIWVQEKLDGSCVSVAKLADGTLVALGRAGYPAASSPYEQHHMFAEWVMQPEQHGRFFDVLLPGERIVGEWLAQACGTCYMIPPYDEPFVAFDIFTPNNERLCVLPFYERICGQFIGPRLFWSRDVRGSYTRGGAIPLARAYAYLSMRRTFASKEQLEGVVYRVERFGKVDFLAKWVRPDKIDGCYLPEVSGNDPVWNWRPDKNGGAK